MPVFILVAVAELIKEAQQQLSQVGTGVLVEEGSQHQYEGIAPHSKVLRVIKFVVVREFLVDIEEGLEDGEAAHQVGDEVHVMFAVVIGTDDGDIELARVLFLLLPIAHFHPDHRDFYCLQDRCPIVVTCLLEPPVDFVQVPVY